MRAVAPMNAPMQLPITVLRAIGLVVDAALTTVGVGDDVDVEDSEDDGVVVIVREGSPMTSGGADILLVVADGSKARPSVCVGA